MSTEPEQSQTSPTFGLAERLRGGGGNQSKPKPDSTAQQNNEQSSTTQQTGTEPVLDPTGENARRVREELAADRARGVKPQMMAPPRFGFPTAGRIHGTNNEETKQEL